MVGSSANTGRGGGDIVVRSDGVFENGRKLTKAEIEAVKARLRDEMLTQASKGQSDYAG